MKRNVNAERRRREDRGAEGAEGCGGVGRGCPLPIGEGLGRRLCPFTRKVFDFGSQYGEF